jgi:hypothetical protein
MIPRRVVGMMLTIIIFMFGNKGIKDCISPKGKLQTKCEV